MIQKTLRIKHVSHNLFLFLQGINQHCDKYKKSNQYHFIQRTEECVPNCTSDINFTSDEKTMAKILTLSISSICFLVSCISLITLMIDEHCCCGFEGSSTQSRRLTKNSIVQFAFSVPPFFSTFCCAFCSFGYLLSQLINHEDFCLQNDEDPKVLLLARDGHRNLPCIIIYLLTYFFGGAISTWWTVIAVSWCVALTSSSTSSSVVPPTTRNSSSFSTLCHMYAWGIPAILTVAGIVAHQVESDELTSICLPGAGFKDDSLLIFVLIPESFQVILGLLFYIVGIVLATMKRSNHHQQNMGDQGSKRAKLETKTVDFIQNRVLIYGAIYIIIKVRILDNFTNIFIILSLFVIWFFATFLITFHFRLQLWLLLYTSTRHGGNGCLQTRMRNQSLIYSFYASLRHS